jgi:hypothetical protein
VKPSKDMSIHSSNAVAAREFGHWLVVEKIEKSLAAHNNKKL